MKYRGKQPSGVDKSIMVYNFTLGKAELLILRDVLDHLHSTVPKSFFTMPFKSRMEAMRIEINKMMLEEGISRSFKRPAGWDPENVKEVL